MEMVELQEEWLESRQEQHDIELPVDDVEEK